MTNAKDKARTQAQGRRQAARNEPEQATHDETQEREAAPDENNDRETDALYDTEGDNEVTEWRRPNNLEAPPSRPGYVQRYIRTQLQDKRDTARLRNAMREGWMPVRASARADTSLPTTHLDKFGDVIGVEDLVLCEMPVKVYKQRQAFYRKKRERQNAAIVRQLQEQSTDGGMGMGPIVQTRRSRVSATQRRAAVADDD